MSSALHRAHAPAAGLRASGARIAALPFQSPSTSSRSSLPVFRLSALALALSWSLPAQAQQAEDDDTAVPTIVVEASPFKRSSEELVQPVDVLSGEELERRRNGTIGDVLAVLHPALAELQRLRGVIHGMADELEHTTPVGPV